MLNSDTVFRSAALFYCLFINSLSSYSALHLCLDNWSFSHLVSRLYCLCSFTQHFVPFAYSPLAPTVQLQGFLVEGMLCSVFFRAFLLSYGMHFLQFGWLASCSCICGAGQLVASYPVLFLDSPPKRELGTRLAS